MLNNLKEMSFCRKLKMYYPYICATRCRRPLLFQTMIERSEFGMLRFKSTDFKDIGIKEFEFVAETQFLCPGFPGTLASLS